MAREKAKEKAARMGSMIRYLALAMVLGTKLASVELSRRSHSRCRKGTVSNKGASGSPKRAGVKLAKRLARRQVRASHGKW